MHPAKASGWNKMPFGRDTCVVPSNIVLDESLVPHGKGDFRVRSPCSQRCRLLPNYFGHCWGFVAFIGLAFSACLPPQEEGGYVFRSVCFSLCLSARQLKKLWMDFDGGLGHDGPGTKWLDSGGNLDHDQGIVQQVVLSVLFTRWHHQSWWRVVLSKPF